MSLFNTSEATEEKEITTQLAAFSNVRIEKIVSCGQQSDWYCQEEDEWVCLLEGNAELLYENGERQALLKGESVFISRGKRHRVSHTSKPCVWLCVFAK
ncbi:MAG: cupin domain-containing protein [Clostridia bacterium]|nr:cupin domain-containing protein [Clostridia bacterium]